MGLVLIEESKLLEMITIAVKSQVEPLRVMIENIRAIEDKLVTTKEAMAALDIKHPDTFRNYLREKGIDPKRNGKPKYYSLNEILLRV